MMHLVALALRGAAPLPFIATFGLTPLSGPAAAAQAQAGIVSGTVVDAKTARLDRARNRDR